jgi:hypothetical protein
VGGTPTHWRSGNGDSKPGYEAVSVVVVVFPH